MAKPPKIPKQYRAPRPTALEAPKARRIGRRVFYELLVVLLCGAFVAWAPLRLLDDVLHAEVLQLNRIAAAPASTVVVRFDPSRTRLATCAQALGHVAESGELRGIVLLPPLDSLCAPQATAAVPVVRSTEGILRYDSAGRVLGFSPTADSLAPLLEATAARATRWLRPFQAQAVPALAFADLESGRVPWSTLSGRVMVAELATSETARARDLAAALAAIQERGQRRRVAPWLLMLLALPLFGALAWSYRRSPGLAALCGAGLVLACGCGAWLSARFLVAGLLPLAHLALGIAVAFALLHVPRVLSNRRALRHAAELIERAALLRSDGIHTIADAEFWPRVGDLASQAHPADSVLVAELPPREWHLKFWPYRGMGENVIKERRRDIRRTPYSNEAGVPDITVTRRYLVMEDTPCVVVPLIALGEVEGYVFLCGDKAEQAYRRAPEIAQRLSQDLGLMLRRRRVGEVNEGKWRSGGERGHVESGLDVARLAEGAELALGDLRMFSSLLHNAPLGLLYADSFGHVRVLGSTFSTWLTSLGVSVPSASTAAPLSPGALMLGSILEALKEEGRPATTLAEITKSPEGKTFELPQPADEHGHSKKFVFTLRALQDSAQGVEWNAGYVGTLVETETVQLNHGDNTVRLPVALGTDVLTVKPLSETVRRLVRAAAAASGRPVQLEPPREAANAIAYHRELSESLEDLLYDVALRDTSGNGPVVTISEDGDKVEVAIMDVQFGLPVSALRRALLGPSDPPQGLETFGRFVLAVSDSHGRVNVRDEDWGVTIVASLLRARPLVRRPSMRPMPNDAEKTTGS